MSEEKFELDLEIEDEQPSGKSPLMAGLSGDKPSAVRKKAPKAKIGDAGPYKFGATELMSLTSQFVWFKLFTRLAFSAGILLFMALGIWLISADRFLTGGAILLVTIIATPTMNWIVNRWFSHMTRLGHVAAITEIIKTGKIPDEGVLDFCKKAVVERFATAQVFFILDGLLHKATTQLQSCLGGVFNAVGFLVPKSVQGLSKHILKVAIVYIDECCLAWIFWNGTKQGDFKGAVDGVVIYFQNAQQLLVAAVKTAVISLVVLWGGSFVLFLILSPFVTGGWSLLVFAAILLILMSIKYAFIDTWVFITMLNSFMQVAPGTEIRFDVYNTLCAMSDGFRKLFAKVDKKDLKDVPKGPGTYQEYVRPDKNGMVPGLDMRGPGSGRRGGTKGVGTRSGGKTVIFCGTCGSENPSNVKFCGDCGDTL